MTLGPDDLILPEMAMVLVVPPMVFAPRPFEERCIAAHAGGFAGLGLALASYQTCLASGLTDADLRAMMAGSGVTLAEIESIGMPGRDQRAEFRRQVAQILEMVDTLGGQHFFVVARDGVNRDELVEEFCWVCDQFAPRDVRVGLEFMDIPGISAVRDLATARDLIEAAGRPNGGLMIDTYHLFNGPNDWAELESLPGDMVAAIQISDGAVPRVSDNYIEDTLHHRAPPGEGDFDLMRFVQTMDSIGSGAPWSAEVIDDDIQALPASAAGRRLGRATRDLLVRARDVSRMHQC